MVILGRVSLNQARGVTFDSIWYCTLMPFMYRKFWTDTLNELSNDN